MCTYRYTAFTVSKCSAELVYAWILKEHRVKFAMTSLPTCMVNISHPVVKKEWWKNWNVNLQISLQLVGHNVATDTIYIYIYCLMKSHNIAHCKKHCKKLKKHFWEKHFWRGKVHLWVGQNSQNSPKMPVLFVCLFFGSDGVEGVQVGEEHLWQKS